MSIVESVQRAALALDRGARIQRTAVGGIYACVQLDSGAAGVAFRFPEGEGCHRHAGAAGSAGAVGEAGSGERADAWAGTAAAELIALLGGGDLVESALALATVNAICCDAPENGTDAALPGDVLDHVDIRDGDRLCMVGCFLPVLQRLEGRGVEVVSVDDRPRPGALPAERVESVLPGSQVALITATSLVNGTLEHLLELARSCRSVVLLGPSTPTLPQAFAGTPAGLLSGIRITRPSPVLQIVAAGGGFRDFRPHVAKVNLRV